MTIYAGEELLVTTSVLDFDETTITDSDVTSVTITIVDPTGVDTVTAEAMTWSPTHEYWYYPWQTPATAGTYKARIDLTAVDGGLSWEIKRIRLARSPI